MMAAWRLWGLCRLLERYHCDRRAWLSLSNDGVGEPTVWMETVYCVHSVQQNVLRVYDATLDQFGYE